MRCAAVDPREDAAAAVAVALDLSVGELVAYRAQAVAAQCRPERRPRLSGVGPTPPEGDVQHGPVVVVGGGQEVGGLRYIEGGDPARVRPAATRQRHLGVRVEAGVGPADAHQLRRVVRRRRRVLLLHRHEVGEGAVLERVHVVDDVGRLQRRVDVDGRAARLVPRPVPQPRRAPALQHERRQRRRRQARRSVVIRVAHVEHRRAVAPVEERLDAAQAAEVVETIRAGELHPAAEVERRVAAAEPVVGDSTQQHVGGRRVQQEQLRVVVRVQLVVARRAAVGAVPRTVQLHQVFVELAQRFSPGNVKQPVLRVVRESLKDGLVTVCIVRRCLQRRARVRDIQQA